MSVTPLRPKASQTDFFGSSAEHGLQAMHRRERGYLLLNGLIARDQQLAEIIAERRGELVGISHRGYPRIRRRRNWRRFAHSMAALCWPAGSTASASSAIPPRPIGTRTEGIGIDVSTTPTLVTTDLPMSSTFDGCRRHLVGRDDARDGDVHRQIGRLRRQYDMKAITEPNADRAVHGIGHQLLVRHGKLGRGSRGGKCGGARCAPSWPPAPHPCRRSHATSPVKRLSSGCSRS